MKILELREMILNEINEMHGGIKIKGHTYTRLDSGLYVGKDGILGPENGLIKWKSLKELFLLAKQNGWIK